VKRRREFRKIKLVSGKEKLSSIEVYEDMEAFKLPSRPFQNGNILVYK